jgi:hypothetical protein
MTDQEKSEEVRKADARVQRWNESVAKVQAMVAKWQRNDGIWQMNLANREKWEKANGKPLTRG